MKENYGLTPTDLKEMMDKIDAQKSYLSNNHFHTATGQVKSLLDVSFSANISERYYAQLSNKINTMHSLAISQSLKPVFLTITLDGFFRDFLQGDFKRYNDKSATIKENYQRHIPNNEVYGFLREKIKEGKKFTVKDCYNTLSYQWLNFAKSYSFKQLKKEGKQFIYLKASEPHKDGVPHFHVLMWIPANYFETFKKDFERYFPAPRNHKANLDGNTGDTYGFQTAICNPVGYIMKYATKSFMDLKNGEDLNYLQAWYIKHKIRRITTSHSTIPQWVYQKCYSIEKDWYHLTDVLKREPLLSEWNKKDNYFLIIEDTGRTLEYIDGVLTLKYIDSDFVIRQTGTPKEKTVISTTKIQPVPSSWQNLYTPNKTIDTYIDGDHFLYRDGELFNFTPQPVRMSDFDLWTYYHDEMDIETVNAHHYAYTHNTMIERGLLNADPITLKADLESDLWGYDNEF
ncbi:MAG: replication endonuclease [Sulfuricurvum sp.]|nr:replication endonuclease [Sulfuricurvum sp.]